MAVKIVLRLTNSTENSKNFRFDAFSERTERYPLETGEVSSKLRQRTIIKVIFRRNFSTTFEIKIYKKIRAGGRVEKSRRPTISEVRKKSTDQPTRFDQIWSALVDQSRPTRSTTTG